MTRISLVCPAAMIFVSLYAAGFPASAQVPQPPATYRGPDTYGVCAYLDNDTEYFGKVFYTSSFFKGQAVRAAQEYAESQKKGTAVHSTCKWSYRKEELTTAAEADRRLVGLPGHPTHFVETSWAFQGGTVGAEGQNAGSSTATGKASISPATGDASTQAAVERTATSSTRGASAAVVAAQNGTQPSGTGSTAYASGVGNGAGTNRAGTANSSGTTNGSGTATGSAGSLLGGSRQAVSDAKANAVGQAAGGLTTATNTAVNGAMGALNGGMQSMFSRRSKGKGATAADSTPTAPNQTATSPTQQGGMNFAAAQSSGAESPTVPANPFEGVIADVAGQEIIVNAGQAAGLRAGQILVVMHVQRVVKDPATGKPLRTVEANIGELHVTSVDANSAMGTYSGAGTPVVGDKVHLRP